MNADPLSERLFDGLGRRPDVDRPGSVGDGFLEVPQQALPGGEHRVAAAVVAAGEPERGAVHPSVVWHDDVIGYPFGFSAALKLVSPSPDSMLAPFLT